MINNTYCLYSEINKLIKEEMSHQKPIIFYESDEQIKHAKTVKNKKQSSNDIGQLLD